MVLPTIPVPANIHLQGDLLLMGNIVPGITRQSLVQDALQVHPVPWEAMRIHDAVNMPLPSEGLVEAAIAAAAFHWDPEVADATFFVAGRAYRVVGITARVEVAGTDGGAVTGAIKKAASGTDIASGTALHTGTINLKGTVDTNQTLTLSATSSDLDIAAGNAIGFDLTGTPADARGAVTVLLAPAASPDDLRLVGGTFGTGVPSIQTGDLKNAGATTKYLRFGYEIPPNYVSGQPISVRLNAGMLTTVASVSATVDVECYKSAKDSLKTGDDLYLGAAQSINSVLFGAKDFSLTPTLLTPGDRLDIRVAIAVNDSATVTAVIGCIGSPEMLVTIRG